MELPPFNNRGDLPPGVHQATLMAVVARFGTGSVQRRNLAERLSRIHLLATSTGHLARMIIFGSFVTAKESPNDVDIILVMDDSFQLESVDADAEVLFRHSQADAELGASISWTTRSGAIGGEQGMLEYWQLRREGGRRGIVEIIGVREP